MYGPIPLDVINAWREERKRIMLTLDKLNKDIFMAESSCTHAWGDTVYDPYESTTPVFSHYIHRGSDPEPVYNWLPHTVRRWTRSCKKCGLVQHTEKQRESKEKIPDFS